MRYAVTGRALLLPLALLAGVTGLAVHASPAAAAPVVPALQATVVLPVDVDPVQPYVGQVSCDATVKPGARALLDLLLRTFPGSTDDGIASSCAQEGMRSEHAEGRALDWGISASSPLQRAQAAAFVDWLFADEGGSSRWQPGDSA